MESLGNVGIRVDSYENNNPILTHIFWGKDINQAIEYAKSHLVSDVFFASTFTGTMKWRDDTLILSYGIRTLSIRSESFSSKLQVMEDIQKMATTISGMQRESGLTEIVNDLSKRV